MANAVKMTREEHVARHKMLHKMLDELFADYISHQPITRHGFLQTTVEDLMKWSFKQTQNPDELLHD